MPFDAVFSWFLDESVINVCINKVLSVQLRDDSYICVKLRGSLCNYQIRCGPVFYLIYFSLANVSDE